jgi:hypothetical protein
LVPLLDLDSDLAIDDEPLASIEARLDRRDQPVERYLPTG